MARAYNNAVLLIRFLAVTFILIGLMGLAYGTYSVLFFIGGGEDWRWLVDPALYLAAQGFFGNPIYLVTGVILLWKSVPMARFVAKYCEPE